MTVSQIEEALKKKAGNISQAAKELGVDRNTIYAHIKASPTLQTVLQNSREELVDIAESALLRGVIEGNMTAIIWTLKASPAAKARGWSEHHQIEQTSINIDYATLTDEQLKRIARGDNPIDVVTGG